MVESICKNCKNSRKTWSSELEEEGYIGCDIFFYNNFETITQAEVFLNDNVKGEIVAAGWVDLNRRPGQEGSGRVTNEQLITRGITYCSKFEHE
jgi:hypothetical protein